ncbi:MAG: polyprenyl synthetase family protein [Clostridia bacterium]|nr:polyprenyl synthetase family protein [Clostridia bacterium]
MNQYQLAVEEALKNYALLLQENETPVTEVTERAPQEDLPPQPLRSAMRYSLLLPGKRIRPVLLLAAYHLIRDDWQSVLPFACALEMIHTYSLVHDDLPAMDNDDLRRGKPTNHRVFGENMAILAGDGLLNMAYETMLNAPFTAEHPAQAVAAMREIAKRAGVTGMIAGQTLDVKLEGHEPCRESVRYIHLHKTADLLTAPVTAGLMLAGATDEQIAAGQAYGCGLGLSFQIQDDLLDLEGDVALLGKQTGMDAQRGKMTWPAVCGVEKAREDAAQAVQSAVNAMAVFGERADFLTTLARNTLARKM